MRRMTHTEATELIEEVFNLHAADFLVSNGLFEVPIIAGDIVEIERAVALFCDELPDLVDETCIRVREDMIDTLPSVLVTIQTEELQCT